MVFLCPCLLSLCPLWHVALSSEFPLRPSSYDCPLLWKLPWRQQAVSLSYQLLFLTQRMSLLSSPSPGRLSYKYWQIKKKKKKGMLRMTELSQNSSNAVALQSTLQSYSSAFIPLQLSHLLSLRDVHCVHHGLSFLLGLLHLFQRLRKSQGNSWIRNTF